MTVARTGRFKESSEIFMLCKLAKLF